MPQITRQKGEPDDLWAARKRHQRAAILFYTVACMRLIYGLVTGR